MKLWKRTIFWDNIKKTLALLSGPGTYGLHKAQAAEGWIAISAAVGFIGALLMIWTTDNDGDGQVDVLQTKKGTVSTPAEIEQ